MKQTFIVLVLVLLGFGRSLATKLVSTNNQSCLVRPMFIDLNLDELHKYSVITSLDRCDERCKTVEDPFAGICVFESI